MFALHKVSTNRKAGGKLDDAMRSFDEGTGWNPTGDASISFVKLGVCC